MARHGWPGGHGERVLLRSSMAFDASAYELWPVLLAGAAIVIAPPDRLDIAALLNTVSRHRVTTMFAATALFEVLATAEAELSADSLRQVVTGGDALGPVAVARFRDRWPGVGVANAYGPTENTVCVSTYTIPDSRQWDTGERVPIGAPVANVRAFVLGSGLVPVPPGAVGELYVAGAQLARGYRGRASLTAERFVACPFGTGDRMYRTGDLVRWTREGVLEFLGRTDDQVKVRGYRIEPAEIEAALLSYPAVSRAVVVARETGSDSARGTAASDKHIVAYVVLDREAASTGDTGQDTRPIREFVAGRLPEFMVPAAIVVLDEMPLTPSGKVDRRALPAPQVMTATHRAPSTPLEEIVVSVFAELLGVDGIGADDDFFALGGHSLSATRVASRLATVAGVEVRVRDVFEAPTAVRMARVLAERLAETGDIPGSAPGPRERPARIPLSFAQLRMWFINRFEPDSPIYNVPLVLRLSGPLDTAALSAALTDVVARHESLRTVFPDEDGVPYQRILPADQAAPLIETHAIEPGELEHAVTSAVRRGFDVSAEPPLRVTLLRTGSDEHVMALVLHHIAADGWSMAPLVRDLSLAYIARRAGRAPRWTPLPVQYADFTLWQREALGAESDPGSVLAAQFRYWERELAGAPQPMELPTDRPRPPVAGNRGDLVQFPIDAALGEALHRLAHDHQVTVSMVLQSALAVLLSHLGAGADISIGGPIAGRTHEALHELVGFFVNTWVLRVDLSGDPSFDEVLGQVRRKALTAYENQDAPFERLVELLHPTRSPAYHPLFQVSFALQNNVLPDLRLADLDVALVPTATGTAKFDLHLDVLERADSPEMAGRFEYATDLFDRATVDGIVSRYLQLLHTIAAEPRISLGRIDILAPGERDRLLRVWNDTAAPLPDETTVPRLFERRAAATPDAVAVAHEDGAVTYRELDAGANRLAHMLIGRGVGRESMVAVALPRSVDLVVAVLAVLKAGAAYLPIDPDYSGSRIEFILTDAAPRLVLTTTPTAANLPLGDRESLCLDTVEHDGAAGELPPPAPTDAAYVIYTSGSTGRPKGVVVEHRSVVNMATHGWPGGHGERVLLHSSMAFDASAYELWPTLLAGAALVVAPPERLDLSALTKTVTRHRVTTVFAATALFEVLATAETELSADSLRQVVTGGDALGPVAVARFRDRWPGVGVANAYGPTENTVCVSTYTIPDSRQWDTGERVPIGAPVPNVRAFVLDSWLRPVPVGVAGELYVAGTQVARGYLGRMGLTAERFVACPFGAGERMYRTGDLVRWTRDGILEFAGRADDQVKIRGYRIEPGEVEAALASHPAVSQAVVVARDLASAPVDGMGAADKQLVAYVVLDRETATARDGEREQDLVGHWQQVYDNLYAGKETYIDTVGEAGASIPLGEDFGGWNSSYTGRPIPVEDMRVWRDAVVERVLEFAPSRVLEIGVGSGLVMARLAPACVEYWGTDFSGATIANLQARLADSAPEWAGRVRLRAQAADDPSGLPRDRFDVVVLNSVVQYFPSAAYLTDVIDKALRVLVPGGTLFLGDVRNLSLLHEFATGTQLAGAGAEDTVAVVRDRVRRAVAGEQELLMAPEFFLALRDKISGVAAVDIELKYAPVDNELTRYRYDVVLRKAPATVRSLATVPQRAWTELGDVPRLRAHLTGERPEAVRITGIPCTGTVADVTATRIVAAAADHDRVADLDLTHAAETVVPHEIRALGAELGYAVAVTWAPVAGQMDAVFTRITGGDTVFDEVYQAAGPVSSVAAYVNDPGVAGRVAEIRGFVADRLPEFMIPAVIVVLDGLPLTPGGKVDRRALPAPQATTATYRAPSTPLEEIVVSVFAEVLGTDGVGVDDDFFALGGHSLSATRAASRVATAAGVEVAVRDVFDAPTAARMARILAERSAAAERPGAMPTPRQRPARIPLSYAQLRMWFINRFEPDSAAYNIPMVLRLAGSLDSAALAAAFGDVVARHESLRTVFPDTDGVPFQRILPATQAVAIETNTVEPGELADTIATTVRRGFDLAVQPPLRITVLRTGSEEHVLVAVVHHIASDGWSVAPLMRDLSLAYAARCAGRGPRWEPLPVQYADYTLWQRELLGAESDADSVLAAQLGYWTGQLAGLPDRLELPVDRPRPLVASQRGGTYTFALDADTMAGLGAAARARQVTVFMVVHAAVAVLLSRLSGTGDIAVGTPIAGRGAAALDGLVGMFVNTLVLRTRIDESASFADLVDHCRRVDLDAFAHADIPFERVVEAVDPARSQAHHPLFQVMLAFQNLDLDPTLLDLPGIDVTPLSLDVGIERFDLTINVVDTPHSGEETLISIGYALDLFDRSTIAAFAQRLKRVLRAVVAAPEIGLRDIDVLGPDERLSLLQWGDGGWSRGQVLLSDMLTLAGAAHADRPAVVEAGRAWTYRELDEWSNRCARALIGYGVGPETVVAIAIPRSAAWMRAVWAIGKTGAAFVSIDPAHPAERNLFMLIDCAATVVLTCAEPLDATDARVFDIDRLDLSPHSAAPVGDADRRGPVRPDNTAYIVYTSGSTGRPKGVAVTHAGLLAVSTARDRHYGLGSESRILALAARTFDAAFHEFLLAIPAGAALIIASSDAVAGAPLAELLRAERVTHAFLSPMVGMSVDPEGLDALRIVMTGADACPPALVERWLRADTTGERQVHNLYGPSEATIWVTDAGLRIGEPVSVGGPIPGVRVTVLDAWLRPVPVGVVGELYVAGAGVARGYLNRVALTASSFVADPYGPAGSRMYRTGDLVRWTPAGEGGALMFVGRADFQVKIRGQRLELGEIESVLTDLDEVRYAAVTTHTVESIRLAAYVTPAPGRVPDPAAIRRAVALRLPPFMIPDTVTVLEELPLTSSGKVDRRALPAPRFTPSEYHAPSTPVEELVAAVFSEVLGKDRVGVDDDFFALGGDSILSIQLVARAKDRGALFTPRQVFEARTVAGLARVAESVAPATVLAELPGGGVGHMPLTPIVRWLVEHGEFRRVNQTLVLTTPAGLDRAGLVAAVTAVIDRHDMLRARLWHDDQGWRLEARPPGTVDVESLVHRVAVDPDADRAHLAAAEAAAALDRLDPAEGVVLQVIWLDPSDATAPGHVIVIAHHLVVDGVSWRILIPELTAAWRRHRAGDDTALPPTGTSMRRWAHGLVEAARSPGRVAELPLWQRIIDGPDPQLGSRAIDAGGAVRVRHAQVPPEITEALLTRVPAAFHGDVQDALVAALALAVVRWRAARGVRESSALLRLEGHGREEQAVPGADLTATVGWFTTVYPVRIDLAEIDLADAFAGGSAVGAAIKNAKERLRVIPDHGIGYGLLRYLNPETAQALPARLPGQVAFNYLGRLSPSRSASGTASSEFALTNELGAPTAGDQPLAATAAVDINAVVADGHLSATFGYPETVLDAAEVDDLARLWVDALRAVVTHLDRSGSGGHTPSDFPLVRATQADIAAWEARYPGLIDVWPLSPLQSGLLFHARLAESTVDVYAVQLAITLSGLVDAGRLRAAAQTLLERYPNLRVAFSTTGNGETVQIVADEVIVPWREVDLRAVPDAERDAALAEVLDRDQAEPFDIESAPLMRFTLVTVTDERYTLLISHHHVLFDGWSMPSVMTTLLAAYATPGDAAVTGPTDSYRSYLAWLSRQDSAASLSVWRQALDGAEATLLAPHAAHREQTSRMSSVAVDFGPAITDRLTATAAAAGVTMNTLIQVAWAIVAGYLTGRDDVVFGATVSGRPAHLPGIESAVGLFINTIPVRVRYTPDEPITGVLARVQAEQAELMGHHHTGLTDIHAALGVSSLFDTVVVFESYPVDGAALAARAAAVDGMSIDDLRSNDSSHYPLTVVVAKGEPLRAQMQYQPEVFTHEWVQACADRLVRVLDTITTDPSPRVESIDLLSAAERARLVPVRGARAEEPRPLPDLLAAGVAMNPAAPAVISGTTTLGYRELDEHSNRLARWLIGHGAGPGDTVALVMPRGVEFLTGLWAVTKTGAAFVPVDPRYPAERIAAMIADSGARLALSVADTATLVPDTVYQLVLDETDLAEQLEAYSATTVADADRVRPLRVDHAAYILYTSGSTGTPKGVVVTHEGLANFTAEQRERYDVDESARVLAVSAPGFDAVMLEVLMAHPNGAALVVSPPDVFAGAPLADIIGRQRVSHAFLTPSVLATMSPAGLESMRVLVVGGEPVSGDLVAAWAPDRRLYTAYGPTETVIITTISDPMEPDAPVTMGGPIRGIEAVVLDARLRPVPVGVPGELYLGGIQQARCYLNRPVLTATAFIANPFGRSGSRLYRTGDLVRWTERGALEFLGRNDFQIKVRGQRVELGEIEAVLAEQSGVSRAVVVHYAEIDRLAAYLVGDDLDPATVLAAARRRLPAHMVPDACSILPELPLTASGKLDRAALPEPVMVARAYLEPSTPTERAVAEVFAELLAVDRVGADDDFFALGGHSLSAMRVASRVSAAVGVRIGVRDVFEASTPARLARVVDAATDSSLPALVVRERPARVPLSFAQWRMWFVNRFDGASGTYNIPLVLRLTGVLDVAALTAAIGDVVARHESLRTVFPDEDGTPYQQILPVGLARAIVDVRPVDPEQLDEVVAESTRCGFDLSSEPPVRVTLLEIGSGEHVLVLVVHHIAADGWSIAPLARDLSAAYLARRSGRAPGWDPLPVQYADYTLWQREVLGAESEPGSVLARQLGYWAERLAGLPDRLELPTDRPRPPVASHHGAAYSFVLDAGLIATLREVANAHGATVFMVVHAALSVLLSRLAGTADIAVGTPIAGRGAAVLDDLVGMFVNTLVLRTQVDEAGSFTDLLDRVRRVDLDAFAHADVPFERVVEVLDPPRSQAHHPLFQVMLAFQNLDLDRGAAHLPGIRVTPVDLDTGIERFDLTITVADIPNADGDIPVTLGYAVDLFDRSTIAAFAQRLRRILHAVAADPTVGLREIDPLEPGEREVLREWENGGAGPAEATLVELLSRAATEFPARLAVVDAAYRWTYRDLDGWSNRCARALIGVGVGPETVVAIAIPRSLAWVRAVWTVAKTGAAFVSVDPAHPWERNRFVLTDAAATVVLIDGEITTGTLGADAEGETGIRVIDPDRLGLGAYSDAPVTDGDRRGTMRTANTAYLVYTSGSTGAPKGVAVTHAGLTAVATAQHRMYGVRSDSRVLSVAARTFDAAILELLLATTAGAALITAPSDAFAGPALAELMRAEEVTHACLTPTVVATLDPRQVDGLRALLAAGEACPPELVARWSRTDTAGARTVYNLYGPSEATIWVTGAELRVGGPVALGAPIPGIRLMVLDAWLRPVPRGVVGELYAAGAGVARGYLHRIGLTAATFVADPYGPAGSRMYRTGDLVRWLPAGDRGTLMFVGRADFQVKIRGQRLELGEIEAVLSSLDEVEHAVVTTRTVDGGVRLAAYVTAASGHLPDPTAVRQSAAKRLPAFMVPDTVTVLDELPLTSSGKVDRRALPAPQSAVAAYRAPSTPVEEIVAAVFAQVLDIDRVGVDDDFFALGGHSLSATRVASRVATAVGTEVGVRDIFQAPTAARLAQALTEHTATLDPVRSKPVVRERPARVPLSFAQWRMWFINRLEGASATYNIPLVLRLTGALDVEALAAAIGDVVARHESLRTVFPDEDGTPYQRILPAERAAAAVEVRTVDPAELDRLVIASARRGFDVSEEPPLRATVLRNGSDEHVLVLVVHHIAADGWSMAPLAQDLTLAYTARREGRAPQWAPLPVQYADYTLWQREILGADTDPDSVLTRQLGYWTGQLAGLADRLELPSDRPRPAVASQRGGTYWFALDADTAAEIRRIARTHQVTMFMVLHAAVAVLLSRLADTGDIAIGTPIAGRGAAALDGLVGMFVNTLVLRTRIDETGSFADLLDQVRRVDLDAFAHADVPFERVVEVLDPPRSQAHHPLFQVMLAFQNLGLDRAAAHLPGVRVTAVELDVEVERFDLTVTVSDTPDANGGMPIGMSFALDLFDRPTIAAFAQRLRRILGAVAADPTVGLRDVDVLEARERQLLREWGDGGAGPTRITLADMLSRAADEHGDRLAIVAAGREWTYRDLDERSNRYARALIECGAGPEAVVAIAIPRSAAWMHAVWAVAKTGAAFVSIDPSHPDERNRFIRTDCDATIVLISSETEMGTMRSEVADAGTRLIDLDRLDVSAHSAAPVTDAERGGAVRLDNTAYLVYTSGSTGAPKGVAVTHAGLSAVAAAQQRYYRLTADSRVLSVAARTFDAAILELLLAIPAGAASIVAPGDAFAGPPLAEVLRTERVTHAFLSPAVGLSVDPAGLDDLQVVLTGAEACPPALVDRWSGTDAAGARGLYNLYGPSETTIWIAGAELHAGEAVSVGGPIPGVRLMVLDACLRPTPPGVVGELYVAGAGVARGYAGRPGTTASSFMADPFGSAGSRMYRTGDLVRWTLDGGVLMFVGRADFQVKIRGQRLELGEIEAVLADLEEVQHAVVTTHGGEDVHLAAYVTPVPGHDIDPDGIRRAVSKRLPAFMIPETVTVLDELPLTASGKVDRRALPAPQRPVTTYRAPSTPLEEIVTAVFSEVLEVDRVGVDDNFFALGGNSMVAMRLVSQLRSRTGARVPYQLLFSDSTPASLARYLEQPQADMRVSLGVLSPLRSSGSKPPLFCVHPGGGLAWVYGTLVGRLDPDRPVYGLQDPYIVEDSARCESVDAYAQRYVEEILKAFPDTDYYLLGWSLGGKIAHTMAAQLQQLGHTVGLLVLVDAGIDTDLEQAPEPDPDDPQGLVALTEFLGGWREFLGLTDTQQIEDPEQLLTLLTDRLGQEDILTRQQVERVRENFKTPVQHTPRRFDGDAVLFLSAHESHRDRLSRSWHGHITGHIQEFPIDERHAGMLNPKGAAQIGPILNTLLEAADGKTINGRGEPRDR
ncbi:amino acid adenylation domain-containing protein [Nocardia terpenica]|uniref:Amino acid adenylation domain-containing protein n=2 Tax=Nocardia terpenica TaxID=455432 RepID=A0A6G9Z6E1_9NOCA|nr:amino acid adenylation domain-containing protein [Nocardia terpenica]